MDVCTGRCTADCGGLVGPSSVMLPGSSAHYWAHVMAEGPVVS